MKQSKKSKMLDILQKKKWPIFSNRTVAQVGRREKEEDHKIKVNRNDTTTYSECVIYLNLDSILSNVKVTFFWDKLGKRNVD